MGKAAINSVISNADDSKPTGARVQWPSAASAGGAAFANIARPQPVVQAVNAIKEQVTVGKE